MSADRRKQEGYERSDAHVTPLFVFAAALAVLVVVSLAVSTWIESSFTRSRAGAGSSHPLSELREEPTGPLLQARPVEEVERQRARESRLLGEYAWIDRTNGVVRIPIEQAMRLVAERGLPHGAGEDERPEEDR